LLSIVRDAQNILFTRLSKVPLRQLEKKESEVIAARLESLRSSGLSELSAVIGRFLNLGELFGKPTSGRGSRDRIFSTQVTFWAFLHQVLTRNMACRDAVRKVQAMRAERGLPIPSEKSDAYCQARIRLPTSKLLYAHAQLVTWLGAHTRKEDLWLGHDVKVVDGTGVSMPDTADNQARWPQTASQEPGCGFPQAKLVGCFSLASAGLLAWTLKDRPRSRQRDAPTSAAQGRLPQRQAPRRPRPNPDLVAPAAPGETLHDKRAMGRVAQAARGQDYPYAGSGTRLPHIRNHPRHHTAR
jgi:hypothetical protein